MGGITNGGREGAYRALRESEELHRAVLGNISDAVFLTDDDGRFTFICPNVDAIFGYAPDEVQAMSRIGRLLGDNLFDGARLAADGEIQNIERDVTSKSGERRSVLIHAKKVSIKGGTVLYACRDVTERRSAEERARIAREELAHASRLAVVGELLASIVHEISQPLLVVTMNAGAGLRVLDEGEAGGKRPLLREMFSDIQSSSSFANEVIERLRMMVRKQAMALSDVDAREVVGDLLALVRSEAQFRGITLRSELDSAPLVARADRVCLRQVLLNLISNAMDAVSVAERERIVTLRARRSGEGVELSVVDTGPGIPAEQLPRLFDAFFTTKEKGIGLGLTIARSLTEAQHGAISVAESGPAGTEVRVTLSAPAR